MENEFLTNAFVIIIEKEIAAKINFISIIDDLRYRLIQFWYMYEV